MADQDIKLLKDTEDLIRAYNTDTSFRHRVDDLINYPGATYKNRPLRLYVLTVTRFAPQYKEYERSSKQNPQRISDLFVNFYRDGPFSRFAREATTDKIYGTREKEVLKNIEQDTAHPQEQYRSYHQFLNEQEKQDSTPDESGTVAAPSAQPEPQPTKPPAPNDTETPEVSVEANQEPTEPAQTFLAENTQSPVEVTTAPSEITTESSPPSVTEATPTEAVIVEPLPTTSTSAKLPTTPTIQTPNIKTPNFIKNISSRVQITIKKITDKIPSQVGNLLAEIGGTILGTKKPATAIPSPIASKLGEQTEQTISTLQIGAKKTASKLFSSQTLINLLNEAKSYILGTNAQPKSTSPTIGQSPAVNKTFTDIRIWTKKFITRYATPRKVFAGVTGTIGAAVGGGATGTWEGAVVGAGTGIAIGMTAPSVLREDNTNSILNTGGSIMDKGAGLINRAFTTQNRARILLRTGKALLSTPQGRIAVIIVTVVILLIIWMIADLPRSSTPFTPYPLNESGPEIGNGTTGPGGVPITPGPTPPPGSDLSSVLAWARMINDELVLAGSSYTGLPIAISNNGYTTGVWASGYVCTYLVIDAYNLAGFTGTSKAANGAVVNLESFWKSAGDQGYIYVDYQANHQNLQYVKPGYAIFEEQIPGVYTGNEHTAIVTNVSIDANGNGSITTIDANGGFYKGWTYTVSNWNIINTFTGKYGEIITGFGGH
ncbi:hypothetical protein M1563_01135 [Patescibacteria group bacterium]|nr:hypothetical protein [Patescibacteria group bacterium]